MDKEVCYACDSEATSAEHVPPKCIFPELKDFPHKDLRKNLITVPSCDKHNSAKSKDDEFLMISLAGMLGNNSIGYAHSVTKVDRALRRTSYKLLESVFVANRRKLVLDVDGNRFVQAIAGTPDLDRLNNCADHMARGIYRHHFGESFRGSSVAVFGFLIVENEGQSNLQQFLLNRARRDTSGLPKYGANQSVFFYQVVDPDENGIALLNLCFFENIEIFCALVPEQGNIPRDLGFELMKWGLPVKFMLDGKEYPVHLE